LQNARRFVHADWWAFGRCQLKWFCQTAQELAEDLAAQRQIDPARRDEEYYVFQKQSARASATFVTFIGRVQAQTPAQALSLALVTWSESRSFVWWVFPACAVTRSQPEDVDSMFATAKSKTYRHSTQYHTVTQMKQVKSGKT
jgi:ring-1,2-phenylacetyl-CoA epoxidase subunit PaaB